MKARGLSPRLFYGIKMQYKWLHQKNNKKLILFFNGWGMDEKPFLFLESDSFDVLMLYDYSDLNVDIRHLLKDYSQYYLIAWSMGVWVSYYFMDNINIDFDKRLAINGSLLPIHEDYGINPQIYDATLDNFSEKNRDRFFRRMFSSKNEFEDFMTNKPARSLTSQKTELIFWKEKLLKKEMKLCEIKNPFERIWIGKKDKIIPYGSQNRFWVHFSSSLKIIEENYGHFPFYNFRKWDDFLS